MNDCDYMARALQLAKKGMGWTAPNPMVGAVIVKNGQIIGEGWHQRYGQLHAERNALNACREDPKGATLYVTLEPCCHYGKQPPCVDAVRQAGISRVVVGSEDPNPLVSGKGIKCLRSHGIEVTEGVLKEECDRLNEVFFYYIRTKRPFVVMKYAMTMDGKTAAFTGASKWITGKEARAHVHEQRHQFSAIMVGVGTVLADDPMLNCRLPGGKNPVRIICDTHLRTPPQSQVIRTAREIPTILATCCLKPERQQIYRKSGCRILCLREKAGHVDLTELMEKLGQEQIDSILLEGGGTLNWAALESGIVRRVSAYIAPKLFGGTAAHTPVGGTGVSLPDEAFRLGNSRIQRLGEDFLIESEVFQSVYRNH
ncbi:MAG TPA: bifunctional diaminohydroxyphosphoribosylaminopyrimidine deaminase/5-amino-6-(5-phosphoribosylamino)uracil reductase RibD [Candidatus Enterocloster faecavium]|uniref:Riboflavin biosynthesis protein RibD n=1 Tax=Candidatus Enterocloster faecavium TaxID=2838560 RepID=A0A9D2L658_9FIRM|nr:bifunctional diaminohydroxyphosphoribosylaminopyrimidine deaminase/5-amino-6-(5-phosphoribosylamino)uracil reductase RibD [Candidatus Enterocloster faecavium]